MKSAKDFIADEYASFLNEKVSVVLNCIKEMQSNHHYTGRCNVKCEGFVLNDINHELEHLGYKIDTTGRVYPIGCDQCNSWWGIVQVVLGK